MLSKINLFINVFAILLLNILLTSCVVVERDGYPDDWPDIEKSRSCDFLNGSFSTQDGNIPYYLRLSVSVVHRKINGSINRVILKHQKGQVAIHAYMDDLKVAGKLIYGTCKRGVFISVDMGWSDTSPGMMASSEVYHYFYKLNDGSIAVETGESGGGMIGPFPSYFNSREWFLFIPFPDNEPE
jgi:hypothetical protein